MKIEGKAQTDFYQLKLTMGNGGEVPQPSILDPQPLSFLIPFHSASCFLPPATAAANCQPLLPLFLPPASCLLHPASWCGWGQGLLTAYCILPTGWVVEVGGCRLPSISLPPRASAARSYILIILPFVD